jgi:hypothetical protein
MPSPIPPKPEESDDFLVATELRDAIAGSTEAASRAATSLQRIIADRLKAMRSGPAKQMAEETISITDGFEQYLMESTIRSIGRLLPQASRVYLRSPEEPDLIYLASYEFQKGEMTVRIGSNFLR